MWEEEREDKKVYELPKVGRALQGTGTDSTIPSRGRPGRAGDLGARGHLRGAGQERTS